MDEQLFPANAPLLQHAHLHQLLQIHRGGLAASDLPLGQILDSAIRQLKNQIHQLVAVNLRCGPPHMFHRVRLQFPDRRYLCHCPARRLLHAPEHEQHPFLPSIRLGHLPQQPIIVRLVPDDITAQVEREAMGSRGKQWGRV